MTDTRLFCRNLLLPDGWASDVLLELGPTGKLLSVMPNAAAGGATRLKGYVIPGMPNVHSHGFQYLMAGRTGAVHAEKDHFWSWREQMYRLANAIDPAQYEVCLAYVYLQMLRAGYTACAEFHYLHHQPDGQPYADASEMSQRVLSAARRAGMPVTLLPVLYCQAGFASEKVEPAQRRFRHDVEAYERLIADCRRAVELDPLQEVGVAPHSLRAVPEQVIRDLSQWAPIGAPVHIHVAEQVREVEESCLYLGGRPVEWLLDHAPVNDSWCLVHATHMTVDEQAAAAASGAVAGLCPTTEADLGDGVFDLDLWLRQDGAFGIGSDSNTRLSVSEELRLLEYEQRLSQGRRNVLARPPVSTAETLYTAASSAGAQALGHATGELAVEHRADFVELDPNHPLLSGLGSHEVMDAWIFAGDRDMIRSVWVAGKPLVENGRHAREEEIERAFRSVIRSLREQ